KPFQKVIDVSSGDPHRAGMPPLSFAHQVGSKHFVFMCFVGFTEIIHPATHELVVFCLLSQVLAACLYPELLKENRFPSDVRQRAQKLLGACNGGSVGKVNHIYFVSFISSCFCSKS
ncbi:hypothetical protein XENOCAPTIV_000867, partial [Xenoophorus captivus]